MLKTLTIIIIWMAITTSCTGQREKTTVADIRLNNIDFKEITCIVDKKTKDTLHMEGLLKQKTVIGEIPCYGQIAFNKGWELKKITLAEDHVFGANAFPRDTEIRLGIKATSLKRPYFSANTRGGSHERINAAKFTSDPVINSISCDSNEEVYFSMTWDLIGFILSAADTVAGNVLPKGTFVRVNKDGPIQCYCLTDPVIQGYVCSGTDYTGSWMGGGGIQFYPGGRLNYFQPVGKIEIQGVYCKHSSTRGGIWLYESGQLKKCTSAKDQTIDGVFCGENFTVEFDRDGKITHTEKKGIFN